MVSIREIQESKRELTDDIILIKAKLESLEQNVELTVDVKQAFYEIYEWIDDLDRSMESFAAMALEANQG